MRRKKRREKGCGGEKRMYFRIFSSFFFIYNYNATMVNARLG